MSIIAPDTEVTLYANVEVSDHEHLIFATEAERTAYFTAHMYKDHVDCSYQRIGEPLVLELPISDMYKFNYISFKNRSFENKIIFARTLNPVYINNDVLAVPYVVDDWTTFMFDIDCEDCSVLREHITEAQQEECDNDPYSNTVYNYPFMHTPEPLSPNEILRKKLNNGGGLDDTYVPIIDFGNSGNPDYAPALFMFVSQVIDPTQTPPDSGSDPKLLQTMNFASCVSCIKFPFTTAGMASLKTRIDAYTTEGATSSILGIYILPDIFDTAFSTTVESAFSKLVYGRVPRQAIQVNKKILHFPYTYFAVTDPLGNTKEYHIERFDNITSDDTYYYFPFRLFYTFNGAPEIVLCPVNYNGYTSDGSVLSPDGGGIKQTWWNCNFYEKMVFNQFPQVAYNTDGYLTWLGNTLRGQMLKDTTAAPWAYNDVLQYGGAALKVGGAIAGGVASTAAGSIIGPAGTAIGAASGIMNVANTGMQVAQDLYSYDLTKQLHNTAQEYKDKGIEGIDIPLFLSDANRAFVKDDYHSAGTTSTLTAYMLGRLGFYFRVVSLKSNVEIKYQRFWDKFGYCVNDIKIPNLFNIIKTADWNDVNNPIFRPIQYEGGTNRLITYVKTQGCNITSKTGKAVPLDSIRTIETMMDNGHRFIKGVEENA